MSCGNEIPLSQSPMVTLVTQKCKYDYFNSKELSQEPHKERMKYYNATKNNTICVFYFSEENVVEFASYIIAKINL